MFYFHTVITVKIKARVDQFLEHLLYQKRYSKHTIVAYKNDLYSIADFIEHEFEIVDLQSMGRRHITSFIANLAEQGFESRTINRKLSAIQAFMEFWLKQGLIKKNPARNIDRPKVANRLPTFLRSESMQQLFDQFQFTQDFNGVRDLLILMLLYGCGLRREELITLRDDDVDFHQQQIRVLGKRNKERIIPVGKSILEIISSYRNLRSVAGMQVANLLVTEKGKILYPSLVYKVVKNYLSQVTTMDKRSPHVLRHTFATMMLNEGANLQSIKELLGHSSLAATQVYTHTSLEKLKEVYKKSHPRNQKS